MQWQGGRSQSDTVQKLHLPVQIDPTQGNETHMFVSEKVDKRSNSENMNPHIWQDQRFVCVSMASSSCAKSFGLRTVGWILDEPSGRVYVSCLSVRDSLRTMNQKMCHCDRLTSWYIGVWLSVVSKEIIHMTCASLLTSAPTPARIHTRTRRHVGHDRHNNVCNSAQSYSAIFNITGHNGHDMHAHGRFVRSPIDSHPQVMI